MSETEPFFVGGAQSAPKPERPTAVYWLFADGDALLYVGMTNNPIQRFAEHSRDKPWWPQVTSYAIRWYDTRARAEAAEKAAILNDGPLQNVEFQPRDKRHGGAIGVPWYLTTRVEQILIAFTAKLLPDTPAQEQLRLAQNLMDLDLGADIFDFFGPSRPRDRHPLDMDALLATLDAFGPIVAPADPKSP